VIKRYFSVYFYLSLASLFFLIFIFNACSPQGENLPEKEILADEIMYKTAETITEKLNLIFVGTGGDMINKIKKLNLSFQSPEHLNIENGRILVIKCAEEFLKKINSFEKIRPYLKNYPFKSENIDIIIFGPAGSIKNHYLSPIMLLKNKIYYSKGKSENSSIEDTYEEPYETALEIVKKQPGGTSL
jgi:hypothetical protein